MIHQDLKNANILIVDDQQANIDVLFGLLDMNGFKNIKTTTDSTKVLDLVQSFKPDLILLDLLMPKMSGFDVLWQLKEIQVEKSYIPVLVLTAELSDDAKQLALTNGAKDFITKPFNLIEVSLRIKNLLETRFLYKTLHERYELLDGKLIDLIKIMDEWYK
jgi:DNA-binding response OmpR family regulator